MEIRLLRVPPDVKRQLAFAMKLHHADLITMSCDERTGNGSIGLTQLLSRGMEKSRYINVDELQAQTTLEEAAARCGVRLESRPRGSEVRIDCPFHCPGDHAGRKEISVNTENPQKVF